MVYLLHFSTPYHHARHYLGTAEDLDNRLDEHRRGRGARLLTVVAQAGITFELVRTWPGGRDVERRLKRWHSGVRLCPICRNTR
jgi:predicted GIY-YIG superfamily endonuclease